MICLPFSVAWAGHTDASRELAQDIAAALMAAGISHKAAALTMGIHPADFSRQLNGQDGVNLWRLTALDVSFWSALIARRAARIGGVLLTADQLAILKGAAHLGPRMVNAVLEGERKRA